jgi:hypothetical protein
VNTKALCSGDRELKKRSLHIIDVRRNKGMPLQENDCTGALSKNDMLDARETYWGPSSSRGPNRAERKSGLKQLYTNVYIRYLETQHARKIPAALEDQFVFEIGNKGHKKKKKVPPISREDAKMLSAIIDREIFQRVVEAVLAYWRHHQQEDASADWFRIRLLV